MAAESGVRSDALRRLLKPRSVAIVGASSTPGALGTAVLENLARMGFDGDVHLINPKRTQIGALRCLPSIEHLPLGVDAAVLAIPRVGVLEAIHALARRKVGAIVIFAAGFGEGDEEGRREQTEIAELAARYNLAIEGPNCLGFVNHLDRIALTFVETPAVALDHTPGIGIVSQSGAMAAVLSVMVTSRQLGITYSISTGNEAALHVEDFIEVLIHCPHTRVIGMIVEQFRQPQRFLQLARTARSLGKHVVLLHPGRTRAARESAATHTGALAGDFDLMRANVEGAGVILVQGLEELGDVLEIRRRCPIPRTDSAAIVTESGAFKALALDLSEQSSLPLATLTDQNAPALRAALPRFVPVSNPLDLTAQSLVDLDLYRRALSALSMDDRVGAVLVSVIQTDSATCDRKFPALIGALTDLRPKKPVILAGLDEGAAVPAGYIDELRALGVPYFPSPERALRALARVMLTVNREHPPETVTASTASSTLVLPNGVIAEYRAKALLASRGIAFPAHALVHDLDQAQSVAATLGFPVALKAQSAAISHKSDVGGVMLGLSDPEAVATAWRQLHRNLLKHCPGVTLEGVLVERMAPRGLEMIIGGRNDPDWGPVVLAGIGGIHAELLNDVRLFLPDQSQDTILRELSMLKMSALLSGFRGSPPLDLIALADLISRLGKILLDYPTIREMDLNPVIVYPQGQGVLALDALMCVG